MLAAIERKSHADFAASFKDGRHENIRNAATACKLEGPAFPCPTTKFGGIPSSPRSRK